MESNVINKNTMYERRIFNKYVSFNFKDIAVKRKDYFENSSFDKISICIPISQTERINILQILALRKAESLAKEIPVRILIKSSDNKKSQNFKEKIRSKFNFKEQSFIFISEINKFTRQSQPIFKKFKEANLSDDIVHHLSFITKLLLYLNSQKINSFLVGQNEAFLYEAILEALIQNKKYLNFFPLYIPELQLFVKTLFKEGDSVEDIKKDFLDILLNYRSIDRGLTEILVLASFYDIKIEETPDIYKLSDTFSNCIFNDLSF